MVQVPNEETLIAIAKILSEKQNFCATKYSTSFIDRRVSFRMRTLNLASVEEYYTYIKGHDEELPLLEKELSINVTHFFRDASLWEELEQNIFPELINKKKAEGKKQISIWSAGCSSGEEAITIASIFANILGENYSDFKIHILGTDISPTIISSAKEATYHEFQFKEMKPEMKKKYFIPKENDLFQAKESLRNITEFKIGNILTDPIPQNIDLIFCRNTVIYFNREAKNKLYEQFYDALNLHGFFIMGKTETLSGPATDRFKTKNPRERIYYKE